MAKEKIEQLLRALPAKGIERVRSGLGEEIKRRIPVRLKAHRLDMINIIVDLRISRLAAAAAILVALVLVGALAGGREVIGRTMYHDSKLLLKYTFEGEDACKSEVLAELSSFRDSLAARGREVVYYGDQVDHAEPYTILMHWRISEDKYGVVFGDLSARTVSGRLLIQLQANMLAKPTQ